MSWQCYDVIYVGAALLAHSPCMLRGTKVLVTYAAIDTNLVSKRVAASSALF